jgi:hypothetical protein
MLERTALVEFDNGPFPYRGIVPRTEQPFLNAQNGEQRGHRTWRGRVLWEKATFNDSRSVLHIPKGFDIDRPGVMIVFFHGHGATLQRDVVERQQVPAQVSASGSNAVLVAPQFAVDAADSSAGKFWQPGGFARYLDEAAKKLARMSGDPAAAKKFASMPVVIVAYSGGFAPAAFAIERGGVKSRIRGVVLLDALYGELDTYASWIKDNRAGFFISAYTRSTARQNAQLEHTLDAENIDYATAPRRVSWKGVTFLEADADVRHRDFVTFSWAKNPIRDVLTRLDDYRLLAQR